MARSRSASSSAADVRPFAWLPLISISLCIVSDTLVPSSLSTYAGVFTEQLLGLSSLNLSGYYTGWLAIAYTFGTILTSYAWGRFADRIGRKPVMIIGMCASGITSVAFGLSTSFGFAVVSRFFFGLANSVMPIGRVMVVELLDPEYAVIGMALIPGSRSIGTIIGPALGGLLAQPATSYPSTFSPDGLFARYPFLLPNLAVAFWAFATIPLVLAFLPETLHAEEQLRHRRAVNSKTPTVVGDDDFVGVETTGRDEAPPSSPQQSTCFLKRKVHLSNDGHHTPGKAPCSRARELHSSTCTGPGVIDDCSRHEETRGLISFRKEVHAPVTGAGVQDVCISPIPSRREQIADPKGGESWFGPDGMLVSWRVRLLLVLQCLFAGTHMGFVHFYPLWLLASGDAGGLGWTMSKIGGVLGWTGVGMTLYQFVTYPALCRTLGIIPLLRSSGVVAAVLFLVTPDIQHSGWGERHSFVVGVALVVLLECTLSVIGTASMLASAHAVPVHMRGQFSGMFAVAGSLGRATGPMCLSSLLAWSLERTSYPEYHLVFVLESILALGITALGVYVLTLEALTVPIEERKQKYAPLPEVLEHDDDGCHRHPEA